MKQRLALILIGALISGGYYLLNYPSFLDNTFLKGEISNSDLTGAASQGSVGEKFEPGDGGLNDQKEPVLINGGEKPKSPPEPGNRLEIFGQVVDEYNQPVDNVHVAEERYFYSTRTDLDGKYKIFVDMPGHQHPVLRFLRSGFDGKRIKLDAEELKNKSRLRLDVALDSDIDSMSIDGWIGNDIGAGLGGLKIQITSRGSQGVEKVFHTVFSDERGDFILEGIRSGDSYKLTVFSTPEYLYYVDEEFSVDQNSPQLKIILESLNFVDIDGMIVNSKALPVPNFEIYIRNISTGTHVRKIVTDSSGFFSLHDFPAGEVSLSTQGPEYFKINGLKLAVNEYGNLKLVVDKGDHYLSGWVSDENGIPLPKVLVQLNAKIEDGDVVYSSSRVTGTDSGGNFNFDNLGSGVHLLSIDTYGFHRQEIIHRFDSQTDKIHISLSRK